MDVIILLSHLRDPYGSAAGAYAATMLLKRMKSSSMDNILVTLESILSISYNVILIAFCHSSGKLAKKQKKATAGKDKLQVKICGTG